MKRHYHALAVVVVVGEALLEAGEPLFGPAGHARDVLGELDARDGDEARARVGDLEFERVGGALVDTRLEARDRALVGHGRQGCAQRRASSPLKNPVARQSASRRG